MGEKQADTNGSATLDHETLFSKYYPPTARPDIPSAPGRTLVVDAARWRYYAEDGPFLPRGWIERMVTYLLGLVWACCCWAGRSRAREGRSIIGLPMLRPEHWVVHWWDALMTAVDMSYSAFIVAISLAFDNIAHGTFTWLTISDIIGTCFYLVDMLMGFHVGVVVRHDVKRVLVMDGWRVGQLYVCQRQFWVNVIACVPIIPEIITSASETGATSAYRAFYALRLLRLLRVARLLRLVWGVGLLYNPLSRAVLSMSNTATLHLVSVLFTLALLINLLGCIWWFVAELEGLENSWVANTEFQYDLLSSGDASRWVASCYYAITTMTTVGYGDITPVTVAEQVVAMVFMAISIFYFSFVINVVGELVSSTSRTARTVTVLRNKLEDMDSWMEERHMPHDIKKKVRTYYVEVWAQHTGAGLQEAAYMEELPVALRGEIVLALAEQALQRSHMFSQLSHEVRSQLAASAVPVRLVAGHNLYEEGDEADSFYVLQEGEAIVIHGISRTSEYHSPALLGQAAVFAHVLPDCQQRLHTVRASTNCTLWQFPVRQLGKLARRDASIMQILCNSFLQYIGEARELAKRRGHPMPRRLSRIHKQVQELLSKVSSQGRPGAETVGTGGTGGGDVMSSRQGEGRTGQGGELELAQQAQQQAPSPTGGLQQQAPSPAGGLQQQAPSPTGGLQQQAPSPTGGLQQQAPSPAQQPWPPGSCAPRSLACPSLTRASAVSSAGLSTVPEDEQLVDSPWQDMAGPQAQQGTLPSGGEHVQGRQQQLLMPPSHPLPQSPQQQQQQAAEEESGVGEDAEEEQLQESGVPDRGTSVQRPPGKQQRQQEAGVEGSGEVRVNVDALQ